MGFSFLFEFAVVFLDRERGGEGVVEIGEAGHDGSGDDEVVVSLDNICRTCGEAGDANGGEYAGYGIVSGVPMAGAGDENAAEEG